MVDILTDTGVFLDLDPDAEFEITIENPLLQEDRIPVPFSTAIAFLPTPTNKRVFGYLDTMMLEPTVRELAATILAGGIPLYAGTLVYDSIDEDGRINYTFSGKDLQEEWSTKLWELPGLSWDENDGYDYQSFLAALKADQQEAELAGMKDKLDKFNALYKELLDDDTELEGVKVMPYESYHALAKENRGKEGKPDIFSLMQGELEGILWEAPKE